MQGGDPLEHTPGPWSFEPGINGGAPGIEADDFSVVVIGDADMEDDEAGVKGRTPAEAEANARLMASAPELLDALKAFVAPFAGTSDERLRERAPYTEAAARVLAARAAIAKAEGRS